MNERRTNQSAREQAQSWFDALRNHLASGSAQNDVVDRLRTWATIEDLLADCPQLLPPLMTMAWQLRHQQGFAELFQATSGGVAADTKTQLAQCRKSFDDVILAHLLAAMRLYCERQEQTWLAAEKARYQPQGLAKVRFLAPIMRLLKPQKEEKILSHYPQRGLYMALKPYLRSPNQFALIEALATLPTTTVTILGAATRGLSLDSSIRNLAALETRKCKFVVGLALAFAEAVVANAAASQTSGANAATPPFEPRPTSANLPDIAGTALTYLVRDGLHLAKAAIAVRECARDVVEKMSVPLGYGMWQVFRDSEEAWNIAHCPAPLAHVLGENAVRAQRKASEALNSINDRRVIEPVVKALLDAAGREKLVKWATVAECVTAWQKLAAGLSQSIEERGGSACTPEEVAAYCLTILPSFEALAAQASG